MYPSSMVQRAPRACGCRRPKVPDDGRAAPAAQHAASFKAITPASFKRLLGGALAARSPRLVQIRLRHAWRLCWGISGDLEALSGGEHGAAHRHITRERLEADGWAVHVDGNTVQSPPHEIRCRRQPRATESPTEG